MANTTGKKFGGRKRGTPNRVDAALRAQFEQFLYYASDDILDLFERLKAENPKQALDAIKDYAEFVLPKLARTEQRLVDKDGNDKEMKIIIERKVINAPDRD